jgi:hypothetical protein
MSAFLLTILLIGYVWWPLAKEYLSYIDWGGAWWLYIDWLLLGIFLVMSLLIMSGANLRADAFIVLVGLFGGLVIESWGTQTNIWFYYTAERPPLWIIPAWPIASLSIDRLFRAIQHWTRQVPDKVFFWLHWSVFPLFYALMLFFVLPTLGKSLTQMSLLLCAFLILTPRDYRGGVLTFIAGSGLGYFLELWGTTRECWIYYTRETPPLFAVLAHGMAAVAFWRVVLLFRLFIPRLFTRQETR